MANPVDIVIADAATTPVTHTFKPNGKDEKGVQWFVDRSQANAVGFWRISIEVKQPSAPRAGETSDQRVYRVRIGLHEPILANITNSTVTGVLPAPQVAYIPRSFIEYLMPERTVLLDRANLFKMTHLLAANSQVKTLVEDLDVFNG